MENFDRQFLPLPNINRLGVFGSWFGGCSNRINQQIECSDDFENQKPLFIR